jgi:MerR family transcriptional regulator, mercuric resistance operon regulatory protein
MVGNLTIARLAAAAGVGVETVRYYQRRGLVAVPPRPLGGVRRYGAADVERLRFVRRAQSAGFTLAEVDALLRLRRSRSCRDTRALAQRKLRMVEERLSTLLRLRGELEAWIAACERNPQGAPCPVAARLAAGAEAGIETWPLPETATDSHPGI